MWVFSGRVGQLFAVTARRAAQRELVIMLYYCTVLLYSATRATCMHSFSDVIMLWFFVDFVVVIGASLLSIPSSLFHTSSHHSIQDLRRLRVRVCDLITNGGIGDGGRVGLFRGGNPS